MTIDHFSLVAAIYDRVLGAPDLDRMKRLLRLPAEGRLLDAGGGTGRVSSALVNLVGDVIVGDFSRAMLKRSQKKDGLHPVRLAVEQLPFPDEIFSRVVVVDALHHFRDQRQAVKEFMRVLKPGGRLLIEEPDIDRLPVKAAAVIEKILLMTSRFNTAGGIVKMIECAGRTGCILERRQFRSWIAADK